MLSHIRLLSALVVAMPALAMPATAEPFYMIAQIEIEDQERFFNEYGPAAIPAVLESGGRVLVASPTVDTLEGDWAGNWTVVIEFPSEEAALQDWYNDVDYQKAIELRHVSTSLNNLVVAPGFVPPAQ